MFLQRASVRSTSAPRFKVSLRHSADDDPSSWGANPCDPHSPPKKGKRAKTDWAKTPHVFLHLYGYTFQEGRGTYKKVDYEILYKIFQVCWALSWIRG